MSRRGHRSGHITGRDGKRPKLAVDVPQFVSTDKPHGNIGVYHCQHCQRESYYAGGVPICGYCGKKPK